MASAGAKLNIVLSCAAALLVSCATAKVSNEKKSTVAITAPDVVYVGAFDLTDTPVQSDPGTLTGRPRLLQIRQQDPNEDLKKLSDLLAADIIDDLNRANIPAQALPSGASQPTHGWIVTGQFLNLDEGNRAQRSVIGFGVGTSDAKLYVTVADAKHPEDKSLLNFNTDSAGDSTPGGGVGTIVTHTPWGMVAKFVLERNASEKDVQRTAQAISDEIVKFLAKI
jgi:Domain of unknown function (DUF4410)